MGPARPLGAFMRACKVFAYTSGFRISLLSDNRIRILPKHPDPDPQPCFTSLVKTAFCTTVCGSETVFGASPYVRRPFSWLKPLIHIYFLYGPSQAPRCIYVCMQMISKLFASNSARVGNISNLTLFCKYVD